MKKTISADIGFELKEIGRLISSAELIMAVRREVSKVLKDGFVVTDGKHHPSASEYQVVVRCRNGQEVGRRIRANIPNIDVNRIAENVLGIRTARRSKCDV